MTNPKIHFAGSFSPPQVTTAMVASTHTIPPDAQTTIDAAWEEARLRLGDRLYDGPMARLQSWRIENNRLHLTLGRTSYKPFLGTNLMHPELADQYGPDVLANPLGISALLQTSDGYLVLGRRGGGVAFHAHRIHPLGGTVEEEHQDVFAEILRELKEEAELNSTDIIDLRCVGLAEDTSIRQPELMFHAATRCTLAQINLDESEHDAIWPLRAEAAAVERAMRDADLTPIAVAALRLWYDAARP